MFIQDVTPDISGTMRDYILNIGLKNLNIIGMKAMEHRHATAGGKRGEQDNTSDQFSFHASSMFRAIKTYSRHPVASVSQIPVS